MKENKTNSLYTLWKDRILSGEWKPGEKLPSKRLTADQYGVSLITVERAYSMLIDEGYLTASERRGYFVSPLLPDSVFSSGNGLSRLTFLPEPSPPASSGFETDTWFKTVRKVLSEHGNALFCKAPSRGCAILRNAISAYLLRYRGMYAPPQRIVIGSGAEQLYESLIKLLGRDKIYGIEDPSYSRMQAIYRGMGVTTRLLRLGEDGIEEADLLRGDFQILHVTPFHSFPSGVSTSAAKRYAYLSWAEAPGRRIIEDDYASEFFSPGHPLKTLYAMEGGKSVIYLNTFSKSISPAVRIGYMILPEDLQDDYDRILGGFSCSVPVMDQYILAEFLSGGHFERHLNRIRREMNREKE